MYNVYILSVLQLMDKLPQIYLPIPTYIERYLFYLCQLTFSSDDGK